MDVKGPPDFSSSCIFFEASGDSDEADYYDPNMGGYADENARFGYDLHDHVADGDDDDALSCSYDRSDSCNAAEANWGESCDADADDDDDDDDDGDDEHDGDDVKKGGVYGASYCEDDEMLQEEHHKSFVSFDSNQEFVDEMEKNRLFWEACLAS